MPTLLVATQNRNKLKEYRDLLDELPAIEWAALQDVGLGDMSVEETGTTFEANAILKAEAYGTASGLITLADDSGLVVPSLNGDPGVYSARYGGPTLTTDADRYRLLLSNLANQPDRSAYFICVIAIYVPGHPLHLVEGRAHGTIVDIPRGHNGFGYDPVFQLDNDGRTMAELPPADKNILSHRGRALQNVLPYLKHILSNA